MGEFQSFIGVDFWTALFTLLNFLAVFFVGKRFLWGPVTKMVQERQKEIDDMYSEADTARASAKAMEEEYQGKLSDARATSEQIVRDAVIRGQAREEEIIRQANLEADAIREKAAADIAREKKKALNEAKNEISDLAMEIAGKVVGASLDSSRQEQLVNGFLEELGEQA